MSRSRPLAINSETGEPVYLPASAQKYEPWKVLILDIETQERRSRKYFSYKEAKGAALRLREKMGPSYMIGVVSRQMGYGPPYSKISDRKILAKNEEGYYWCPYCRAFRRYMWNAWREKRMCEFCQTVDTDFHVQANNPVLWDPRKIERLLS